MELLTDEAAARRGMRIAGQMMVGILAERDYGGLETMTSGRHLSADELRQAVESLGQPIIRTPESEWPNVSVMPSTTGSCPEGFDFVVPLWTAEGRSGLGMAVHPIPTTYGTFEVEIEGFVPIDADAMPGPAVPVEPCPDVEGGASGRPSESPVPERWQAVLGEIVHRLVVGDYAGLAADGLVSYTDDPADTSIGRWIEDYPAHLVDLPDEAWAYSEHGPWVNAPGSWWVIVDLWTAEEGRSDLSMEATVWDDGISTSAKVDNVHVM